LTNHGFSCLKKKYLGQDKSQIIYNFNKQKMVNSSSRLPKNGKMTPKIDKLRISDHKLSTSPYQSSAVWGRRLSLVALPRIYSSSHAVFCSFLISGTTFIFLISFPNKTLLTYAFTPFHQTVNAINPILICII